VFRLTQYIEQCLKAPSTNPVAVSGPRKLPGPVVIWNLIRRCNLACRHCYTTSADIDFAGELTTDEVFTVMDDLKEYRVPVLILSGGEPLMRPDIFDIAQRAKSMGFYVGLSSNGTLISEQNIHQIAEIGFDYVGVSIDGLRDRHDAFRRLAGSFDASMAGIRLLKAQGLKVGLRFTLTQENATDLPGILTLMDEEGIDKFYLSHLNYGGRGYRNRSDDATFQLTRGVMDLLFETCLDRLQKGRPVEFVTGNNDADGVYLLHWVSKRFPAHSATIEGLLKAWGGNASGINIANIDNLGTVHPDTFWWHHGIGNVRDLPFSKIWQNTQDELMQGLRMKPRRLEGRCGQCTHVAICNGNTRVRAHQMTGNAWAEDPGCYLFDDEIGLSAGSSSVPSSH
jgi:Fe-coproporphyrin III synthase